MAAPTKCPNCNNSDIEAHPIEIEEAGLVHYECGCRVCGHTWKAPGAGAS